LIVKVLRKEEVYKVKVRVRFHFLYNVNFIENRLIRIEKGYKRCNNIRKKRIIEITITDNNYKLIILICIFFNIFLIYKP